MLKPFIGRPAAYHERTGGTISPSVRRTCSCSQAKPNRYAQGAEPYAMLVLAPPTVPRFGELAAACETILRGSARAPSKRTNKRERGEGKTAARKQNTKKRRNRITRQSQAGPRRRGDQGGLARIS